MWKFKQNLNIFSTSLFVGLPAGGVLAVGADVHMLLLESMLLPSSMLMLVPMLLQVFLLKLIFLLLAPVLFSLSMLLLVPMLLQVFCYCWPLLLLVSLHHDVAAWCLTVAYFTSPMPKKPSCLWRETLFISPCRKSLLIPGVRPFPFPNAGKPFGSWRETVSFSPMPLPVPGERPFPFSHAEKNSFPAWGYATGLPPGTGRLFWHGEKYETLWVAENMFLYWKQGFPSLACNYPTGSLIKKSFVTMHFDFKKYN